MEFKRKKLTLTKCEGPVETLKQVLCDVWLIKFKSWQDELRDLGLRETQFLVVLFNPLQHTEVDECKHVK